MRRLLPLSLCLLAAIASAQTQPPRLEPQINPDHTVTFHLAAPTATKVEVSIDLSRKPFPMTRDAGGIWSYTTEPLSPEIYGYHFEVDGRTELDPRNPHVSGSLVASANGFLIPGDSPEPWEATDVPHGELHLHSFTSRVVVGLERNQDEYYVYTPPNYDSRGKQKYPVLYLLHGWSDRASGWSIIGRANLILDTLIAQGKARPMIVVMPLGYGDMSFVRQGFGIWNDGAAVSHNVTLFQQSLLSEIIPQVESTYNVAPGRDNRAIAGLSMGGLESVSVGLANTSLFSWIGGFSAAIHMYEPPPVDPKLANLHLLWIACGTSDDLIRANRRLIASLTAKGFPVTAIETPGLHTWLVWRDNLVHFVPLLFQGPH